MNVKKYIDQHYTRQIFIRSLLNRELLVGLFFLMFILGLTTGVSHQSYNDFRVFQVLLILVLVIGSWCRRRYFIKKLDFLFFSFIMIGSIFWQQPTFIITELLLVYLSYKNFQVLNYQPLITKLIVLSSLSMFLLLPLSIWDYINTGIYRANWYPLSLNIRVYDSYFLIMSIFAVWFYLTEEKYKKLYLLFVFLAFLAVLLDGARSVTIAYTLFIVIVSMTYCQVRWYLFSTYVATWLTYLAVTYITNFASETAGIRIVRESSSGRIDLWMNAYQCWSQHPIIGCGFYQLEWYPNLSAHPHNLFIQVLTETGILGFGFLIYIVFMIMKRVEWLQPQRYFIIAAFLAVGIDLFFSGVHIYPVTQMVLLWLFVFLLKSSDFSHAQHFRQIAKSKTVVTRSLSFIIYLIIAVIFMYIFIGTTALTDPTMSLPPRFWINGYKLF